VLKFAAPFPHSVRSRRPFSFFRDVYSLQSGPRQLEFGHVFEDPNVWEQRYEKKDFDAERHQGMVRPTFRPRRFSNNDYAIIYNTRAYVRPKAKHLPLLLCYIPLRLSTGEMGRQRRRLRRTILGFKSRRGRRIGQ